MYTISSTGIQKLKEDEGVRRSAYKDVAGYWTTGVGHLIKSNEQYLITKTLTDQEVTDLLRSDLADVITAINKRLTVPVSQNMVDALASLLFNIGVNGAKDLFSLINSGAPKETIYQWWSTHYVTAGGVKIPGLVARRKREAALATGINSIGINADNSILFALAGLAALVLMTKKNR